MKLTIEKYNDDPLKADDIDFYRKITVCFNSFNILNL